MSLSVVLIARNQERTVGGLIESVLRDVSGLALRELLLVDSGSADATADVALVLSAAVLKLPEADWLCAAASRFAGFAATSGDYVLFLDGDMELCHGWLARALRVLESEPSVAAVAGRVVDPRGDRTGELPDWPLGESSVAGERAWELPHPGGAAVYRRTALLEVGSFNPYLRADEEPELALRLRARGYRIIGLDRPSVVHHDDIDKRLGSLLARRRRGLFRGEGQMVRVLLWDPPALTRYLRERGYAFLPAVIGLAGLSSVAGSLATRRTRWATRVVFLGTVALGADAVRRRSASRTALAVLNRVFYIEGLFRGLLEPPGDPAEHPALSAGSWVKPPEVVG